jgi:hypothetical protein
MNAPPSYDVLLAEWQVKQARKQLRESKKALAAARASESAPPPPPAVDYDALMAAAEEIFVPVEVVEEAAAAKRQIIIRPNTVLSLPEDVEELVDRVRAGEMAAPLDGTGTARYTKDWQAGRRGDPGKQLCRQIREQIRAGVNTKKAIVVALHGENYTKKDYDDIDAAVREMSKMGVILC